MSFPMRIEQTYCLDTWRGLNQGKRGMDNGPDTCRDTPKRDATILVRIAGNDQDSDIIVFSVIVGDSYHRLRPVGAALSLTAALGVRFNRDDVMCNYF